MRQHNGYFPLCQQDTRHGIKLRHPHLFRTATAAFCVRYSFRMHLYLNILPTLEAYFPKNHRSSLSHFYIYVNIFLRFKSKFKSKKVNFRKVYEILVLIFTLISNVERNGIGLAFSAGIACICFTSSLRLAYSSAPPRSKNSIIFLLSVLVSRTDQSSIPSALLHILATLIQNQRQW